MIGIRFKIKNEYNTFLNKILSHIDTDNFQWIVAESEVYFQKGLELFDKQVYTNSEFQELIKYENYYTVFCNIQLYNKEDEIYEIHNYEEFLKSKCVLVLFITDNEFVEIYMKNKKLLEILKNNASANHFSEIELIPSNGKIKKSFSAYGD